LEPKFSRPGGNGKLCEQVDTATSWKKRLKEAILQVCFSWRCSTWSKLEGVDGNRRKKKEAIRIN